MVERHLWEGKEQCGLSPALLRKTAEGAIWQETRPITDMLRLYSMYWGPDQRCPFLDLPAAAV